MGDRRQKRAWLRLVGAVDNNEPSGSSAKSLNASLVDSTLGSIQGDDIWVALACLDAIESRPDVTLDLDLTRHLLTSGLQRTDVGKDFNLESKHVRYKLAIRRVLLRYRRMMDVWTQVYSGTVECQKETELSYDGEDEFDAWEDAADTTSSPIEIPLLEFIKASPLDHAMHLASTRQHRILTKYIQALPRPIIQLIHPYRLTITKILLLSASAAKADLGDLLANRLLPDISNGTESDLWTDLMKSSQEDDDDVSDSKEVIGALELHHMNRLDESSASSTPRSINEDSLSSDSLLSFYTSCINDLEKQSVSNISNIQLARFVSSNKLNINVDEKFARLAEDLQLLQPLVHGSSSNPSCSSWNLQRFREELNARPDLSQKQAMATLFIEEAQSDSDATKATCEGIVPFLRSISQRSGVHVDARDQIVVDGLSHVVLALADKNKISIVRSILNGAEQYGVELSTTDKARITLACLLGTTDSNAIAQRALSDLAASTLSTLQAVASTGQVTPLRECIGIALNHVIGQHVLPSQQYRFFDRLELPALRYYIERCRLHLSLLQRLAEWNSALTVPWLFSAEGQHDEQESCVTRIVRSFAREQKSQSQWATFTRELLDSVGSSGSFDALDTKDLDRLVLEGALRTGDSRIYSYVLKEQVSRLSDAKREDIILLASREFYDNATSTNVYQGDMKTSTLR